MVEISKEELEKLEEILNQLEEYINGDDEIDGLAIFYSDYMGNQHNRLKKILENIQAEHCKVYEWFNKYYNKE